MLYREKHHIISPPVLTFFITVLKMYFTKISVLALASSIAGATFAASIGDVTSIVDVSVRLASPLPFPFFKDF
jgi:hypothetical protein